jgi:tetratricopeptide (TPR) repeat protein
MTEARTARSFLRFFTLRRALAVCAPLLVVGTLLAQNRQAPTPADAALRALNLGQFSEVEQILGGRTDAQSMAIRARAMVEQGQYANAEKLLAAPAKAEPASEAALELGLLQLMLGRRAEGTRTLERLLEGRPRTGPDYLRLARAAYALGTTTSDTDLIREANDDYLREANRLTPDDPYINTFWGELLADKYELPDALKSFQIALKADENNVAARTGMARLMLEQNPAEAKAAVDEVLKINSRYVPAHLLAAEIALDERRRDDAKTSIAEALKVNPNHLKALSLRGAVAFLEGRDADFERQAQEVLAISPAYGEVYRTAGDHAARNYLFDEAVALTKRAQGMDPVNAKINADLGLHLMRTGDEGAARESLEASFKGDAFKSNTLTLNLLTLLDELDKFETITDGKIVFRFHPEEAAVMREYALPLAKEALATLEKLYQFEATGPILIEMFPEHDDFAVRTLGLPGMIGALGACFGRVVTLDSPRARKPGEFNWGETLWHEMAHVITLQMSNNRIPRWLSEGASDFESRRKRTEWAREMEVPFVQALEEGKILKLADLNEGFSDPRTISLAYFQSSLVVEHLVQAYGEPKYQEFIRSFSRGLETPEAMKAVFGVSIDEIQKSFDAFVEKRSAAIRQALKRPETTEDTSVEELKKLATEHPGSFGMHMQLGIALNKAGDKAAAIQSFERAAPLIPWATGESNPHAYIAQIALEQKDNARAIQALEALLNVDHSDVEAARKLASLVGSGSDAALAERAYQRVVDVDPFDAQAQLELGRLALKRKESGTALRALRAALAANPADRVTVHTDLAEAYLLAGDRTRAKQHTLDALEIAPTFERALDLLLRINEAGA